MTTRLVLIVAVVSISCSGVFAASTYQDLITPNLRDGGFESSVPNGTFPSAGYWKPASAGGPSGTAYAVCTTTAAKSGNRGLWCYTGSEGSGYWSSPYQEFAASPGDIFRAEAWIRQPTDPEGTWVPDSKGFLRLNFLNRKSQSLRHVDSAAKVKVADQGWTLCIIPDTKAPSGTAYVRLELRVHKPAGTKGVSVVNFDDCVFQVARKTLFANAEDVGGGWKSLDWFGFFNDRDFPWICHAEHKWLYCLGESEASIYFWTPDMRWVWTSADMYPYFYRFEDATWLRYLEDSADPRWFHNLSTGTWESR